MPPRYLRAREAFEQGLAAAGAGDWTAAAQAFEASVALVPRRSTLFNLALAQLELNRPAAAHASLNRWLAQADAAHANAAQTDGTRAKGRQASPAGEAAPEHSARARVTRLLARLESALGVVSLVVTPSHARVTVDGDVLPAGTTQVALEPGAHGLHAEAEGHHNWSHSVEIAAGQRLSLDVALPSLQPEPQALRGGATRNARLGLSMATQSNPHVPAKPPTLTADPPDDKSNPPGAPLLKNPWFWGSVAAAVVATALTAWALSAAGGDDPADMPYHGTLDVSL